MPCLVDIPGRPALFLWEREEQWMWEIGEAAGVGGQWEDGKKQRGGCGQDVIYEIRINKRK